jgi:hypothetical protein
MTARVTLLGPQRFRTTARSVVRSIAAEGPVATVNAGWEEREPDDAELDGVLEGRSRNLRLHARWLEILDGDEELARAERRRRELLEELQAVYEVRLHHALEAVHAVRRRRAPRAVVTAAVDDALAAVRSLDAWHLRTVREVREEYETSYRLAHRHEVARHRAEVAQELADAAVLVIPGGHVGVLLHCLRMLDVASAVRQPVVAWSAGAMVVSERVVLFHDFVAHGHGHAEVYDAGLGLCRGVVPLPHARRRLRVDDAGRMAVLARRFEPDCCLVLDEGVRVDVAPDGSCAGGVRVLSAEGRITTKETV